MESLLNEFSNYLLSNNSTEEGNRRIKGLLIDSPEFCKEIPLECENQCGSSKQNWEANPWKSVFEIRFVAPFEHLFHVWMVSRDLLVAVAERWRAPDLPKAVAPRILPHSIARFSMMEACLPMSVSRPRVHGPSRSREFPPQSDPVPENSEPYSV